MVAPASYLAVPMNLASTCNDCGGPRSIHQFCHACGDKRPCSRDTPDWTEDQDGHLCARCKLPLSNRSVSLSATASLTIVHNEHLGVYAVRLEGGDGVRLLDL